MNRLTILDDGEFYIELNSNCNPTAAPGFLQRRCTAGPTIPGGYECLGSFQKRPDGAWAADINAPWNRETDSDCTLLVTGVARMDAIGALWSGRHRALSTHN